MQVSTSTQSNSLGATRTDSQKAGLDYDAFLKLLLQQLKSQDPTNPVDQKESLAQLAQFSTVEQTIKVNEKLDALIAQTNLNQASGLLGKTVVSLTSGEGGVVRAVETRNGNLEIVLANGQKLSGSEGLRIS